jgi:group I intron endonuclease
MRESSGVYQFLNIVNNKRYVGSSTELDRRRKCHIEDLRRGIHPNSKFQRAWDKYGEDKFVFSIIEHCEKDKLVEREQHWIDKTKCYLTEFGYNLCRTAFSMLGFKFSEESRKLQSRKAVKRGMPAKLRLVIGSPEHKKHMREMWDEYYKDDPSKRKVVGERVREYFKDPNARENMHWDTQEFKVAVGKSTRERWKDPEYRERISKKMVAAAALRSRNPETGSWLKKS